MSIIEDIQGSKITFKKGDESRSIDIAELFDIDEANLTREFSRQASLYAFFATLQADAEYELANASLDKDQAYAVADDKNRKYMDKREMKYTEPVIKSLVIRDEDYQAKYDDWAWAEHEVEALKAIVKALQMRAEMLVSMGAQLRQEYNMTGMNVRERAYEAAVGIAKTTVKSKRVP